MSRSKGRVKFKTNVPRPAEKLAKLEVAIGKTIQSVEWGEDDNPPSIHESESIILHFTDETSMEIIIGSNVVNIGLQGSKKEPCPLSTDLMVSWIDKDGYLIHPG